MLCTKRIRVGARAALFTTPHYDGYGAVLVRLADVDLQLLGELLEDSYRSRARKRLVRRIDERPAQ